jgi:hypothetical protein
LELKTRLSLLDVSKSVKSHGVTIPGLDVREWDTGLELKSGETVIVGELSRPDTSHQSSANEEPSPASDARRANNMVMLLLVRATLMEPSDAGPAPKPGSTGYSSARRADVTK